MMFAEPAEVEIQVFRADELQPAKSARGFKAIFGTKKTKLQTAAVHDVRNAPVWNTQGHIVLTPNDRLIKFKVLDGDHVCGQIQLPVSQIPRRAEDAYPHRVPLQPHRKCANPVGALVYSCFVSKFRPANSRIHSASTGNDKQFANQENETVSHRRGPTNIISSLSTSLTNLALHNHSRQPQSSKERKDRPTDSGFRTYTKEESGEHDGPKNGNRTAKLDAVDGVGGLWTRTTVSASRRSYEMAKSEAVLSSIVETTSLNSSSSLPFAFGVGSQLAKHKNGVADSDSVNTCSTSSSNADAPVASVPGVQNKSVTLTNSGHMHPCATFPSNLSGEQSNMVSKASFSANEDEYKMQANWNHVNLQKQRSQSPLGRSTQSTEAYGGQTSIFQADIGQRPRVTHIDPVEGSVNGGTMLLIRGENLGEKPSEVRAVYVCGLNCTSSLSWHSSTELLVITKPWRQCTGFVIVETSHGRSNSGLEFSFRGDASPFGLPQPFTAQQNMIGSAMTQVSAQRTPLTANMGLSGTNTVLSGVNITVNDVRLPPTTVANPLELTSEICRLKSRIQELQMQNAQMRVDQERMQQYISGLTQKVLAHCPEILCTDDSVIEKPKSASETQQLRKRSISLFSLVDTASTEQKMHTAVKQLRQYPLQSTASGAPRSTANGSIELSRPSVIVTNEILQL